MSAGCVCVVAVEGGWRVWVWGGWGACVHACWGSLMALLMYLCGHYQHDHLLIPPHSPLALLQEGQAERLLAEAKAAAFQRQFVVSLYACNSLKPTHPPTTHRKAQAERLLAEAKAAAAAAAKDAKGGGKGGAAQQAQQRQPGEPDPRLRCAG